MKISLLYCIILISFSSFTFSQTDKLRDSDVFVDSDGVMRWSDSKEEVSLFGVNYTTPFAYAYRAHHRLGVSIKQAIDLDVAQMSRLGFDAFRVHVWDREISDTLGNVLKNDHLDLLDYLLAKLAEHNIKSIITPIAWWGNGWPEPDELTPGFSQKYSRLELITNPKAREAGRNYLRQFIEHFNSYRKYSYKNDPSIIAIEIINEPTHPENGQEVTNYIDEMIGVLRLSGFTKPIFYNISQNWSDVQANAVSQSKADGVSFQWYPTDLVHQKMLKGNYLLNVDKYLIPSENIAEYTKKAKMVYEFDGADVGGSYLYPAMARSFRESGMQFATMFSYDPTQIAWSNTEYPTHFLNLLYTPSKALSLMIAGKTFHSLPRNVSYGKYPASSQFNDFRVSYEEDLSEMNSESEFIYSNSTSTLPKNLDSLKHIAGCGNSKVIQYDGTGAYFLDKLETGVWKLELYPDALWLRDPFQPTSLEQQIARLYWNERKIRISLPDLGEDWILYSLNKKQGEKKSTSSENNVKPGIYLITASKISRKEIQKYLSKKEQFLDGLFIPPSKSSEMQVVHDAVHYTKEMDPSIFKFIIASDQPITNPTLHIRRFGWRGFAKYPLKYTSGFEYVLADTPKVLQSGNVEYCISVQAGKITWTFPEGNYGEPGKWDFTASSLWNMKIINPQEPIVLFNIARDRKDIVFPQYDRARRYSVEYKNGSKSEGLSMSITVSFLSPKSIPFGIQLNVHDILKPFVSILQQYDKLIIRARTFQDSMCLIGLNCIQSNGKSYGMDINLESNWKDMEIPISSFKLQDALLLPNSYPLFLPKKWQNQKEANMEPMEIQKIETMQIILEPNPEIVSSQTFTIEIESIILSNR